MNAFIICISVLLSNAFSEVVVSLQDVGEITFQAEPEYKKLGHREVYLEPRDSSNRSVSLIHLKDVLEEFPEGPELSSYFNELMHGILDASIDSKLIRSDTMQYHGLTGFEFIFTRDFNGYDDARLTKRMFLHKGYLLILSYEELEGRGHEKKIQAFFNSLVIYDD